MSAIRVQRDTPALLSVTFYADGVPTADAPVTVGITKADGSVLVAAGTATTSGGTGIYQYTLARQPLLNTLTVTWTGASQTQTTVVEIVGGFYFDTASGRASDTALASTTTYPLAALLEARNEVEDEFEEITGVAWVPRFRRVRLAGTGSAALLIPDLFPRTLLSVRVYTAATVYTSYTGTDLADVDLSDSGTLTRQYLGTWATGARNLVVEYEHGKDSPPSDLRRAALTRFRYRLTANRTGIPDRATSFSAGEGGTFSIATPGMRGSITGIPDVDVALRRHDHTVAGIA